MNTGRISNQESGFSEYRTLRCTDGSFEESNSQVECIDGGMVDEDDAIYVDYRNNNGRYVCGYVRYDDAYETREGWRLTEDCAYIRRRREYYCLDSDDIVYVDIHDEHMHIDDVTFLRDGTAIPYDMAKELSNGEYVHEDDAVELHDGTWEEESDTVVMWDGQYALESDCIRCDNMGSWYLIGTCSDVATQETI
jgi:hypothetical protein